MISKNTFPALILGVSFIGGASVLAFTRPETQPQPAQTGLPSEAEASAKTYEELANAIIGIEKAEDELVKTILIGYHTAAQRQLRGAFREGADKKAAFEAAANEVTNIANEGDKAIRAVRQRLAQAGHTHNTDVETKEDYMFVTNKEKQGLLALAQKIAKLGSGATADDVRALGTDLESQVSKALAAE
jgi:hypothetical protein